MRIWRIGLLNRCEKCGGLIFLEIRVGQEWHDSLCPLCMRRKILKEGKEGANE